MNRLRIGEVTSRSYVYKACFEAGRSAARRHGLTSILPDVAFCGSLTV